MNAPERTPLKPEAPADRFALLLSAWDKLTLTRVLLAMLLGVGAVGVWGLVDLREQVVRGVLENQAAQIAIAVGLTAIVIGHLWASLLKRGDARIDAVYGHMRDQLADVKAELAGERAERRALYDEVRQLTEQAGAARARIEQLQESERDCRQLVQDIRKKFDIPSGFGLLK